MSEARNWEPATVRPESPDQSEVIALIAALVAYLGSLYAAEHRHLLDIRQLCEPNVTFLVARRAGQAIGCGAMRADPRGWGEIKRMFVVDAARGRGIGGAILAGIEAEARRVGITLLKLETGIHNHEALALYRRLGYRDCRAFGDYPENGVSLFLEKQPG
jgi:putative acetyltransferase